MRVREKILVLDSSTRDRDLYPYSSEYKIPIGRTPGIVGIDFIEANIPLTQDPISERNNTFTYQIGDASPQTVTIPVGIYSETGLIDQLQNAVESSGLQLTISQHRVTFTHPSQEFHILLNRNNSVHAHIGITSSSARVSSLNREYTPRGMIDPTGGARYIKVVSETGIHEHVVDQCDPGMGLYFATTYPLYYGSQNRQTPWVTYPTRWYDRPRQLNSIGVRLENPDGTVYETGNMDHVFVIRLWIAAPTTSSKRSPEYQ